VNRRQFLRRSIAYYWRSHAAVVAGVATAVGVLTGALVVGDSVRGTLRDLALVRIGAVDAAVQSAGFVREALAADLGRDEEMRAAGDRVVPLIWREGLLTVQPSGRRAGGVDVYGVDSRFWDLHRVGVTGPDDRRALVSEALANELGIEPGRALLVRVERPSDVPLESMHANRDDIGRTLRVVVDAVLPAASMGEFSLRAGQGDVRAVFLSLDHLQAELQMAGRVNTLLVARASEAAPAGIASGSARVQARLQQALDRQIRLADLGLHVRPLEGRQAVSVESDAGLIDPRIESAMYTAAKDEGLQPTPVLTYLANAVRTADREIPYSLVSGLDASLWPSTAAVRDGDPRPPIVLTDWALRDLGARVGQPVTLDYYVWIDPGRLETRSAAFTVAGVVPTRGIDRDLAPRYPGITDTESFADWDPPFPIDLGRVRPVDEQYWETYRTTPKAYIPIEVAQRIWSSRFGSVTSVRFAIPDDASAQAVAERLGDRLRAVLDAAALGLVSRDVRTEVLAASRGATDFGQYFIYFSFFLVVSALLLAALFFRLGVEQRAQEIGLLRAVGAPTGAVRGLFLAEAAILASAGALLGLAGALVYGWLVVQALGTWWVDAVRTSALTLHVTGASLAAGSIGGVVAALGCTWWTLRGLDRLTERSLLADRSSAFMPPAVGHLNPMRPLVAAVFLALCGGALALGGAFEVVGQTGAFFGAGATLLLAALSLGSYLYHRPPRRVLRGRGWPALLWLGLRNAADRPGRSLLSVSVIASAAFMIVSVDAFRRTGHTTDLPPGAGGYRLFGEALLPLVADLQDPDARESLGLDGLDDVTIDMLRLRPGDDASCLNLYQPQRPRILGVGPEFVAKDRFAFGDSLASGPAERDNPWRLLERSFDDGAVPAIADANSMTYVLHRAVGEDILLDTGGAPIRLRLVAALSDSVFQSELIIADAAFRQLFGGQAGYRAFLIDTPPGREPAVADALESKLADFGLDISTTTARLEDYHRVENAYLSTFQTLGGLGLVLGTIGLAAVVLRNVLERRRELALLRAVGYERRDFLVMLLSETGSLLIAGLLVGALCASVAIAPALWARAGGWQLSSHLLWLLGSVGGAGLLATLAAARVATAGTLLQSLKSE
jgi:ABC-type antimicrobial peptide transport system permease subunit